MNELNIENLEWLLMLAVDKKEECDFLIENQRKFYERSIDDLEKSFTYQARMSQLASANVCIAVISEQILKLKNVTV